MVKNQDHHLGHLHSTCQRCKENEKLYEFSGSEMSNLHKAIKMRNSLYTTCSIPSHIMSQTVQLYTYLTGWWQAAAATRMVTWHTKVTIRTSCGLVSSSWLGTLHGYLLLMAATDQSLGISLKIRT